MTRHIISFHRRPDPFLRKAWVVFGPEFLRLLTCVTVGALIALAAVYR